MLPLANFSEGHRLGVNGLAVDTEQPILWVLVYALLAYHVHNPSGIAAVETESSAPGISMTIHK